MIVEGPGAHFASERKGAGRRRAAVDRLHHRDAIGKRLGAEGRHVVMRSTELPVALPPLMTSLSDGEPSAPRWMFIAIVPPVPV